MTLYETLEAARAASKANSQVESIVEIEHNTQGQKFICLTCPAEYLRRHIKKNPMPEIVKIIASHSIRTPEEQEEIAARENNTKEIFLSSRGWGDYSPCTYRADLRKSDDEILAGCRAELIACNDVDQPNQSDAEILAAIANVRAKYAKQKTTISQEIKKMIEHGIGYCYSCETYCCGDCDDYQPKPTARTISREIKKMNDEANYGIND